MARRSHQPSRGRRRREALAAAARKRAVERTQSANGDGANPNLEGRPLSQPSSLPQTQPMVESPSMDGGSVGSKRPMGSAHEPHSHVRSRKIRRRSSPGPVSGCPTVLIPAAPLPLAVYQPASIFAMLLVASLLPKNTFSLRWLALSGGGIGDVIGGRSGLGRNLVNNGCTLFGEKGAEVSPSWLAMALDPESCVPCEEMAEVEERRLLVALWRDVTDALEKTIGTTLLKKEEEEEWSVDSVLGTIPRGGDLGDQKTYAGLVNLGNTCYLNAQLQCAYHVPYLRQLILEAKDEVKEVEVEVEVEVEDEEEEPNEVTDEVDNEVDSLPSECVGAEGTSAETMDVESSPVEEKEGDATVEEAPKKKMKTILKKEMKQEVIPRSDALLALQHTFNSLSRATSSSGSGSTNVLCRALGINPYLQQDGQEFWKLFVPEVDYAKMSSLYSGFFEDYVREIVPEAEAEELASEDQEEKKDDGDVMPADTRVEARERVRAEPFLDLSIPVTEGTGGSVQATLREMFTEPEILRVSEGNGWRPSAGADKVDAYKGSELRREGLPSLLQLHLKRFKYDWDTGETSKINDCCSFPLELDLSEISEADENEEGRDTDSDAVYDLQSIVVHKGEYGSGHYYSYVRPDIRRNEWFRFDDEFVTPVEYSDVIADAYGGTRRARRKRSRSDSFESNIEPVKRRRGLFQRILSLFGFFRRVPVIGSNPEGCGFGYGGRTSNAYMLQYIRRSDIPMLYLENADE